MDNTTGPIIYQNQGSPTQPQARFSFVFFAYRLITLALILFIIFAIIQGIITLTRSGTTLPANTNTFLPDTSPQITLETNALTYTVGQNIAIMVKYYTGSTSIQGLDLDIHYDPKYLELNPSDFFEPGTTFTNFPITQADTNLGRIRVSGIATTNQIGFNGSGIFGTLIFKAKASGISSIKLEFTPGETSQTNLIELETGTNILQKATDAIVNIN